MVGNSTRHTVKREIYESTEWENCAVAGYKNLCSQVFFVLLSTVIVYAEADRKTMDRIHKM